MRDRRARLAHVRTPEGAALPPRLAAEIERQVDRLELAMQQLAAVEAVRDAAFTAERVGSPAIDVAATAGEVTTGTPTASLPAQEGAGARLLRLKGIGPETASVLAHEAFFRDFRNRREVASYTGLAPSPWQSGGIDHEQGISKAGNVRVRKTMGQLAWLWLRNQPDSALSVWYRERIRDGKGRIKRVCELLERRRFASQAEAKMACFSFIEGCYNPVRLHSALGYRSPMAYEAIMEVVTTEP